MRSAFLNIAMNALVLSYPSSKATCLHRLAVDETLQRNHDLKLLAPSPEGHARFVQDQPRQAPLAHGDPLRPFTDRGSVGRVSRERIRYLPQPGIARHWQMEIFDRRLAELVEHQCSPDCQQGPSDHRASEDAKQR